MEKLNIDSELKKILQGHYSCSRVWEAWQYGTMKEDDFSPLEEDENFFNDIKELFEKYADIQIRGQVSGWNSVKDGNPESLTSILIYDGDKTIMGYWCGMEYRSVIDNSIKKITHWMYLPTTMYLDINKLKNYV